MPGDILYLAYPLLPVTAESCGGAEQALHTLEAEMAARGYRTTVAACDGSRVAGELLAAGHAALADDHLAERQEALRETVLAALRNRSFDLIHDHSGFFWQHARHVAAPVLATLHLPRRMYPRELFAEVAPNVFFNCVSQAQAREFRDLPNLAGVVENGIDLDRFPLTEGKGEYLLWLGRVCVEKGAHLAIEAADRVGAPLVLAGLVYPFAYHRRYFAECVAPHIAAHRVRWTEQPALPEKVELLRRARAVLIPSLVDETSSLVAMEAMACGTPAVAFRRGALAQLVRHGETGFLVETAEEMAAAVARVKEIDPAVCRRYAEARYSAERMADDYARLYGELAATQPRLSSAA
jgi:glycosyltransferase involved in cell wall biosynthesis